MGGLPAHPRAHRSDENLGGGQERQIAIQFTLNHRGIGTELLQHRQECLDLTVDGEEGIRQRHPAHHRTEHIALIPLRPSKFRDH